MNLAITIIDKQGRSPAKQKNNNIKVLHTLGGRRLDEAAKGSRGQSAVPNCETKGRRHPYTPPFPRSVSPHPRDSRRGRGCLSYRARQRKKGNKNFYSLNNTNFLFNFNLIFINNFLKLKVTLILIRM